MFGYDGFYEDEHEDHYKKGRFDVQCASNDCNEIVMKSDDPLPRSLKDAIKDKKCSKCVPAGTYGKKG